MGTNYYALGDATCNNPEHTERIHIGKSSGGWKFGFRGHPDYGLTSWAAWQEFLADREIEDEYGDRVGIGQFREIVENRYGDPPICRVNPTPEMIRRGYGGRYTAHGDYHDPEGFDFYNGEFS